MIDLKKIDTEQRNIDTMNLSSFSAKEIVEVINKEDQKIAAAIAQEVDAITEVVQIAGETLKNKGRIIYIGAGTSGRLGVLDAVECPPTYGVADDVVIGLIAGGEKAFIKAQEGAEDSKELAIDDLKHINLTENDFVIGIAASGRTPYVIGGLDYATSINANTCSIAITKNAEISSHAKYPIEVSVGAEVVTGSTRMKAGTAQKMILNTISTGAMVLNGKVYQNLMVDVMQTNKKLEERAKRIVMEATECDYEVAQNTLAAANGSAKVAIMMLFNSCNYDEALEKISKSNGFITR